mmetsp:Transcript_44937/g.118717  ORF Transcript_44937/g.118717 Transcript_44937/m.118717 type:complete len:264 (-) Transcript_44937:334-1125(-)
MWLGHVQLKWKQNLESQIRQDQGQSIVHENEHVHHVAHHKIHGSQTKHRHHCGGVGQISVGDPDDLRRDGVDRKQHVHADDGDHRQEQRGNPQQGRRRVAVEGRPREIGTILVVRLADMSKLSKQSHHPDVRDPLRILALPRQQRLDGRQYQQEPQDHLHRPHIGQELREQSEKNQAQCDGYQQAEVQGSADQVPRGAEHREHSGKNEQVVHGKHVLQNEPIDPLHPILVAAVRKDEGHKTHAQDHKNERHKKRARKSVTLQS